jgi:hypothetical protein
MSDDKQLTCIHGLELELRTVGSPLGVWLPEELGSLFQQLGEFCVFDVPPLDGDFAARLALCSRPNFDTAQSDLLLVASCVYIRYGAFGEVKKSIGISSPLANE